MLDKLDAMMFPRTFNLNADGGGGDGSKVENPFGAPPAAAGGDGKPPASGGDGKSPQGQGEQPYFPDKFPDHLKGENNKETIDKMFGAFSGLRDDMAKRGAVPKDAAGYEIAFSEDLQKVYGDISKDAGVGIFKNLALKHGLTDKQAAGLFVDYHQEALTAGLVKTIDVQVEAKKILGEVASRGLTPDQLKAEASKRWQTSIDWVHGLQDSKAITPEQARVAQQFAETSDGLLLLEAFAKMARETGIGTGGQGGTSSITKADLDKRVADPRNNAMHGAYDAGYAAETTRLFKSFYGEK